MNTKVHVTELATIMAKSLLEDEDCIGVEDIDVGCTPVNQCKEYNGYKLSCRHRLSFLLSHMKHMKHVEMRNERLFFNHFHVFSVLCV